MNLITQREIILIVIFVIILAVIISGGFFAHQKFLPREKICPESPMKYCFDLMGVNGGVPREATDAVVSLGLFPEMKICSDQPIDTETQPSRGLRPLLETTIRMRNDNQINDRGFTRGVV